MDKVREACGLPSLRVLVVKRTLRWLDMLPECTTQDTPGLRNWECVGSRQQSSWATLSE